MWRIFASMLAAQTSQKGKQMHVSKVEQEYCLPEKCKEPLEKVENADHRLAFCQFEWQEVGKWNHVGIISSFGTAVLCRGHFCFPSSDFGGDEDL